MRPLLYTLIFGPASGGPGQKNVSLDSIEDWERILSECCRATASLSLCMKTWCGYSVTKLLGEQSQDEVSSVGVSLTPAFSPIDSEILGGRMVVFKVRDALDFGVGALVFSVR